MKPTGWTLDELTARVAVALDSAAAYQGAPNGRVRDVPDARAVRWYTTIGLVDRPVMRGKVATYGPRHLLQLMAIKRRQSQGWRIADIQVELAEAPDDVLWRIADPAVGVLSKVPLSPSDRLARIMAEFGAGGGQRVQAADDDNDTDTDGTALSETRRRFWTDPPGEHETPAEAGAPAGGRRSTEARASTEGRESTEARASAGDRASTTDPAVAENRPPATDPAVAENRPPATDPAVAENRAPQDDGAGLLTGVPLGGGAVLLLPGTPTNHDLPLIRAAARDLVDLLAARGLTRHGSPMPTSTNNTQTPIGTNTKHTRRTQKNGRTHTTGSGG